MHQSHSFIIADSSQVGEARRAVAGLALSIGFSEAKRGELALIITEAANNIVNHAGGGELLVLPIEADGVSGLEIMAVDKGRGMPSVSQCLRDGYSTAGTPGNGMGAIVRLSNRCEIYSVVGNGTVLLSRLWTKPSPFRPTPEPMEVGVVNRSKPGQEVCGDSWAALHCKGRSLFFLADGLGHGPEAATASREAVRVFKKHAALRPAEILETVHRGIRGTRGAAAAIAEVDYSKQEVCFAGIGNIAGSISAPDKSHSMVSHNGILGHRINRFQEFVYQWEPGSKLILHSDGVGTRWQLDKYSGLFVCLSSLVAAVLYRDYQRDNDDATILVARASNESSRIL